MSIEEAIEAFSKFLLNYRKEKLTGKLLAPVDYILELGGKRLRPALTLWVNQLYNGNKQEALQAALAIEMFHNFSLVHDDIMDEAPLRRGMATVHNKWNNNTAILSGDAMLVLVYDILSDLDKEKLKPTLKLFNFSALNVCEGQQLDMDFEDLAIISIKQYINISLDFDISVMQFTFLFYQCSKAIMKFLQGPSVCTALFLSGFILK